MDEFHTDKKYESFKIKDRHQVPGQVDFQTLQQPKTAEDISFNEGSFYEIEYDSCPIPGVGKFVMKPQKIEEPEKDEKRELFGQMREIARAYRYTFDNARFFERRVQQDNSIIFYKQGMFMKDFSDDYSGNKQFMQYFPYYQMMGYEQLRTYFTWRTEVRKGNVADTSLSYAFLYIYELLGNIGVSDPLDGLNQLMSFWRAFGSYDKSIDKYVIRWLKDYHIYYQLPHSFKEFIDRNNLASYYPNMSDTEDKFNLFCNLSKYDIRKSNFFTDDKVKLITECFYFVINKLKKIFEDKGINFDELIFQPTKKMSVWMPFKEALFYPWMKQTDRRIVLSEHEIFICSNNKWSFNTVITSEHGRQLIGYIMKQMEVALRKITNFKFKLSANIDVVKHEAVRKLKEANLSLETMINVAVSEFYKEATKTVVMVDRDALSRIRQEALDTQEKLIVPEQEKLFLLGQEKHHMGEQEKRFILHQDKQHETEQDKQRKLQQEKQHMSEQDKHLKLQQENQFVPVIPVQTQLNLSFTAMGDTPSMPLPVIELTSEQRGVSPCVSYELDSHTKNSSGDVWENLKNTLTVVEINALSVVLLGETELKKYADTCGIMVEVLVDGINEKAMDFIGDNLLDEEFILYDDYKKQVKEMIG